MCGRPRPMSTRSAPRLSASPITRVAAGACDEIREGYRRYSIGSHMLFYMESPGGVDVIRILHQRMDPSRHL